MTAANGDASTVRIPLLVGVTGHRDLVPEEIPLLREAVRHYLQGLQNLYPDVALRLVSALAAGADLLVAEEALRLGLDCVGVLPLPVEQYREDFEDPTELKRFETVLGRCCQSFVCPRRAFAPADDAEHSENDRVARYGAAGELVASLSFVLIALWDGRRGEKRAGTGRTVEYRLARRAWTDDSANPAYQDLLPNLPPDLVYHIVASRISGPPAPGLEPLQQGYRAGPDCPFENRLPGVALLVLERIAEINARLRANARAIERDRATTDLMSDVTPVKSGLAEVARIFSAVDWLAGRMHRNLIRSLYSTSTLTILLGAMFLGFGFRSIYPEARYLIVAFLMVFLVLLGINITARRCEWHRRHLEYRTLAEGLRVNMFWAAAGVSAHGGATAEHRGLLKQADPGLDWILNVIRAASLSLCAYHDNGIPGGVEFAVRHWVGTIGKSDNRYEQLLYYSQAARSKGRRATFAEGIAGMFLGIGLVLAVILATEVLLRRDTGFEFLALGIGLFSLIGGVTEALMEKTAERELQRQYQYMYDVFLAAHDRLLRADSDAQRKTVLVLLGRAALAEHAAWLLVHRDKPVYRSRLQ